MDILCSAKINLTLDVGGRLPNGYHTIDSVMQTVNLFDKIAVERSDRISVSCSDGKLSGEKNITYAAAVEFFKYAKIGGGADIYIEKNIPYPAGLGGGSSDAAGVLRALNAVYKTGYGLKELAQIGFKVGSDVPFFVFGGTKRVMGTGDIVNDVPLLKSGAFVIVRDGFKASTKDMYEKIDLFPPVKGNTDKMLSALKSNDIRLVAESLSNDFETCADTKKMKDILTNTGALASCLSGSGPCVFGIFEDFNSAFEAEKTILNQGFYAKAVVPCQNS